RIGVEQFLQSEIDQADLWARQKDPGHREENARDHQRDDCEREEQRLERRIGALVHPGESGADPEREQGCADGELQGIEKEPRVVAAQIGGAEVLEGELRRLSGGLRREKALPKQKHERHEGERNADHRPFGIEPRRGGGQRSKAPDRVGHPSAPRNASHAKAHAATSSPAFAGEGQGGATRTRSEPPPPHPSPASRGGSRPSLPHAISIMIGMMVVMVMIMAMAVSMIMRMMVIVMMDALGRAAAARILAEQK